LRRIKGLGEMIFECDVINTKWGDFFLKIVDLTKELEGTHLIMDSILLPKDQFQEQLGIEYSEEEVERWLVYYMN
jgi:hypothetical protein